MVRRARSAVETSTTSVKVSRSMPVFRSMENSSSVAADVSGTMLEMARSAAITLALPLVSSNEFSFHWRTVLELSVPMVLSVLI